MTRIIYQYYHSIQAPSVAFNSSSYFPMKEAKVFYRFSLEFFVCSLLHKKPDAICFYV